MLTISILDSDESEIEMFLVKSSKKINTQKTISNKKSLMPSTSHEFSVEKNQSPFKWLVSPDVMKESYRSLNQKAWIITPIKNLIEPMKNVEYPKEYVESQSLKIANQNDFLTNSQCIVDLESTDKMNKIYRIVVSLKYDLKELLSKVDRLENKEKFNNREEFELGNQSDDAVLWNFPNTTMDEDKTFRFKINLSMLVCSSLSET
ncbi:Uncharacterized protein FWK35_00032485, partial [Aphis craccivora]